MRGWHRRWPGAGRKTGHPVLADSTVETHGRVRRATVLAIIITLPTIALAMVGLLIGHAHRTTSAQALTVRAAAYQDASKNARDHAYPSGQQQGFRSGWRDGAKAGRSDGGAEGHTAGKAEVEIRAAQAARQRDARRRAEAESKLAAAQSPPAGASSNANAGAGACLTVVYGICESAGPSVTGHPCPPGSSPNGDGGVVCVPQAVTNQANRGGTP